MVWPEWVVKKNLNRKQINAIPEHKRPVQKEYKTVIDQYEPGGYKKGRLIKAARLGPIAKITPVWIILKLSLIHI
eukprot:8210628-Alexandrium_andersonii.AAC.1